MRKRCLAKQHKESGGTPRKSTKISVKVTEKHADKSFDLTMDARLRADVESVVDSRIQSHIIQKYEQEVQHLQSLVKEKDELILKLTQENGELSTKLSVQENMMTSVQTRLDKVDALVSVHDKAIVSVKENIQGLTFRLANLPLDAKDGRKLQPLPMPNYPQHQQAQRAQFTQMVNPPPPSEPVTIALIGDATFKYIDEEHLFNKMAKCNKAIVNSIDEAKTVIPEILNDQPTCLVFHLGTRDIEYTNSDVCAHKMQECVHLVKELAPDTQMCISLLLPRGDSETNKVKAQLFNFKVQELLAHEGLQFIIHSEMEKDGRLITKYYQPDFININGLDGSRKLAAHLKHGIRRAVPSLQPQPVQGSF
ncbi:hypothetical protein LSH36_128g03012 [Paralvinella palmiformis]|uniref:SGNH hydrolase-type esterase domain-containing protein n=1 Tax=Paralvinella palmiformis TaxID=53620 RepID=A0AAD9JWL5_9ANNE|nr:hypothetical protein LSH36_128g03012 [Paralvinella palmiformis]